MSWLTSAALAAAVSNSGGMRVLGPYAGETTLTIDPVETAERMRRETRKTKELTDKPFAVQYFIPFQGDPQGFSSKVLQVIREEKRYTVEIFNQLKPRFVENSSITLFLNTEL